MSEPGADVRLAIEKFNSQQLDGTALMRVLASFQEWIVPATFGSNPSFATFTDNNGNNQLFMFTDQQAYQHCVNKLGKDVMGEHYLQTTGDSVWRNIYDDIT